MKAYIGRHVQFTDLVNRLEVDPDPLMRGKVVAATLDPREENMWDITVDLSFWLNYNKAVALPTWYDKTHTACLTWFDSGFYPPNHLYSFYYEPNGKDCIFELIPVEEKMKKAEEIIELSKKLIKEGSLKEDWHNLHSVQEIAQLL